eukprot:TRINITY_DN86051_c0_g1_i1.p1 TRINITY_DN86051_c0_g1~~TRINITY_DN86051_c0_g1_i1.p1  ORF type:complete len:355 (+),score=11.72 TRINITY_DN86051_c0_g1_i1:67-1131(+)
MVVALLFGVLYCALAFLIIYKSISLRLWISKVRNKNLPRAWIPFARNDPDIGVYQVVKIVIVGFFLAPTRLFLLIVAALVYDLSCRIAVIGIDFSVDKPLPYWPAQYCQWATAAGSRVMMLLFAGVWVRPKGSLPKDKERYTLMANHTGFLDTLVSHPFTYSSYVAKKEVAKAPLFGKAFCGLHNVWIDRNASGQGEVMARRQREMWEKGCYPALTLYPEGTTTNGRALLKFRKGGFIAGTPCIPVVTRYPWKHYQNAYEAIRFDFALFATLTEFVNYCEIEFFPPYYPSEEEKKDPGLYCSNFEAHFSKLSGLEVVDSTLEDKKEFWDHNLIVCGEKPRYSAKYKEDVGKKKA